MKKSMIVTNFYIKQASTQSDSPILFACSDNNQYWVKDLQGGKKRKAVVNEWIAASLARKLLVPVPDWDAIKIVDGSFDPAAILPRGRKLSLEISFGSKNLDKAVELTEETYSFNFSKRAFDQLTNPASFIEIALFDLWLANGDRNVNNYNIVMQRGLDALTFYAIDHTFIFEDLEYAKILNEKDQFSDEIGCLLGTPVYDTLLKRLGRKHCKVAANLFLNSIQAITGNDLDAIFDTVPSVWSLSSSEKNIIGEFLLYRKDKLRKYLKEINLL